MAYEYSDLNNGSWSDALMPIGAPIGDTRPMDGRVVGSGYSGGDPGTWRWNGDPGYAPVCMWGADQQGKAEIPYYYSPPGSSYPNSLLVFDATPPDWPSGTMQQYEFCPYLFRRWEIEIEPGTDPDEYGSYGIIVNATNAPETSVLFDWGSPSSDYAGISIRAFVTGDNYYTEWEDAPPHGSPLIIEAEIDTMGRTVSYYVNGSNVKRFAFPNPRSSEYPTAPPQPSLWMSGIAGLYSFDPAAPNQYTRPYLTFFRAWAGYDSLNPEPATPPEIVWGVI